MGEKKSKWLEHLKAFSAKKLVAYPFALCLS